MPAIQHDLNRDGVQLVRLESDFLKVDIAPSVGARVVSLVDKHSGHEFLWRNATLKLKALAPGSEYDPNFYGGIDELLPNDIPETINGIECPDHGELWTTSLAWRIEGECLRLDGTLPSFGLIYERTMRLRFDSPRLECNYRLSNPTPQPRQFLWKLHAALAIQPGDVVECPARKAQVVDPAWSRFKTVAPFSWPHLEGQAVNVVPAPNGTMDFFYLFELAEGQFACTNEGRDLEFSYRFDNGIFPYAWLFASYGGFNGHYTVVLEPCTAMPLSVNEAAAQQHCSRLDPGQSLETTVSIYAGPPQKTSKQHLS